MCVDKGSEQSSFAAVKMSQILTEAEIEDLLAERKPITRLQVSILNSPRKLKHKRELWSQVHLIGEKGRKYIAAVRWSIKDDQSFSIILARGKGRLNLIRCNGFHAAHSNILEKNLIPADTCHIHRITE